MKRMMKRTMGTVGDIEGLPFLEAIRQMRNDMGRDNVFYIHLTLLPYITAAQELKTKPTQHSVKELRSIGIQPDAILCRSDHPVSESICEKISAFCDVPINAVIPVETVSNVYEVPLMLENAGLGDIVMKSLGLTGQPGDLTEWSAMVDRMNEPKESVSIALVGKYVEYPDSYISVREALRHAGLDHARDIDLQWVHSEDIEKDGPDAHLSEVCGIVVAATASRGVARPPPGEVVPRLCDPRARSENPFTPARLTPWSARRERPRDGRSENASEVH